MIRMRISVDISDAVNMLDGMQERATHFETVFEKARLKLAAANAENFASGGLPVGGWEPRRDIEPWPLMRKSGKLAGDLSSLSGPANTIRPTSAEFGTNIDYAAFHQTGTFKMAARKVVFEPRGFAEEVGKDAAQHIIGLGRYFSK